MNDVERMQGQLAALSRRLAEMEGLLAARKQEAGDAGVLRELAADLGISEFRFQISDLAKRRGVAVGLRQRGWSAARIARVMGCCERTVERYLAGFPGP